MRLPRCLSAAILVLGPGVVSVAADDVTARVLTVPFKSASMGAVLPYDVILPQEYGSSPSTRYPVLYLLHGLSDHHSAWIARTNLVDHASHYRVIIVTPEGNNGWYTDSATVPSARYGSYLLEELVPDVQRRYRTIEEGYARGIAGLSMGGYGALKLALSHPDEFAFAASLSGALNAAQFKAQDDLGWPLVSETILSVFGPLGSPTRAANDLFALVRDLPAGPGVPRPYLYIACGTDDSLLGQNLDFARLLAEKKIAHEYRHLPGVHNWELWEQQIQEVLKVSAQKMPRR
jgi:putative tributyrin esterase